MFTEKKKLKDSESVGRLRRRRESKIEMSEVKKVKQSLYTPWRRLGGEEV
jgi:hypothetical protein